MTPSLNVTFMMWKIFVYFLFNQKNKSKVAAAAEDAEEIHM